MTSRFDTSAGKTIGYTTGQEGIYVSSPLQVPFMDSLSGVIKIGERNYTRDFVYSFQVFFNDAERSVTLDDIVLVNPVANTGAGGNFAAYSVAHFRFNAISFEVVRKGGPGTMTAQLDIGYMVIKNSRDGFFPPVQN